MEQLYLNTYLSRILSGLYKFIYNNSLYILKYPNIDIKYAADIYAEQEYQNNRFADWIKEEDILGLLINIGLWSPMLEKELINMPTQIEDAKVNLFKNYINPSKVKSSKKTLKTLNNRYNFLYHIRHSFDHATRIGYSDSLKAQYILLNSLYDENFTKIFTDNDNLNLHLLNSLSSTIQENNIPINIFKQIARSDIWRNYWLTNKERIFDKPATEWTDEQKTLVVITKMYDNAYEHPECPPDSVIDDDDMFDGWMILQKRENEKEKNKKRTEKLLGNKLDKAGEVFVMASSPEEATNIYDLNDINAKQTIIERNNTMLKSQTPIEESQLPDVQRNIIMEQNKLYKDKFKK